MITELSLRKLGVEFFYQDGQPSFRGPTRHTATMRAEIDRRAALFRDARARTISGIVKITDKPIPRFAHCMTCGDPLDANRSGMCYLCISAWGRVVKEGQS